MDDDYKVKLEIFEGPLDLLLYLIKKDEIGIYDVSIERITKQYLGYIDTFKLLNVELASEFIVMAANLMYIKSRELLPKNQQPPDEEGDDDDPRWELIRQLVAYKKFKDAAGQLQTLEARQEDVFPRLPVAPEFAADSSARQPASIFDLVNAVNVILKRFGQREDQREIFEDKWTVSEKIEYLLGALNQKPSLKFSEFFAGVTSRSEVVVTFLALLELIRLKQLSAAQHEPFGEIEISRMATAPGELPKPEAAASPASNPAAPSPDSPAPV